MSDKLIEVWYHKVMNEKSIRTPFVPEQQKFCCAAKAAGGIVPKKYLEKLYKIAHRNGAPDRQRRSGAPNLFIPQRIKLVMGRGGFCGWSMPAALPASMQCSSHAMLRPSSCITAQPSASCNTCSGFEPCTIAQ